MTDNKTSSAWHTLSSHDAAEQLGVTTAAGLSQAQVQEGQQKHGKNELQTQPIKSPWVILFEQLSATLVIVLIVAAVVSGALGDWEDAIAILTIIALNAAIGVRQEYQAEQAMAALKKLAVPHVKVRRGGHSTEIDATELTVGDIVFLEAGSAVPADGRLVESASLRIQESALTGESEPVEKDAHARLQADAALADRRNMAYLGTSASYGRGTLLVTAIGMETELGHIAKLIQTAGNEPTPLQKRLDQLGRRLAIVALVLVGVMFVEGLWRGALDEPGGLKTLFLTAVSLAVAAVPEGLSAVVTIALALGSQRMLKRNALIRKLPAVETLGSVTVICSDKTGTLTKNQMTVTAFDLNGRHIAVQEEEQKGELIYELRDEDATELKEHPHLALLIAGGALCNDAVVEHDESKPNAPQAEQEQVVGDPTEGALVLAGHRLGVDKQYWEAIWPRVGELPFDSDRKRMSTIHRGEENNDQGKGNEQNNNQADVQALLPQGVWNPGENVIFTKGALDSVIEVSTHVWHNDRREKLTDGWRECIQGAHDQLAERGMRVLGVAFHKVDQELPAEGDPKIDEWERDLTFVGLVGMLDPPRAEAKEAIAKCRTAGIRVLMITGDHPLTARSIADKLGLDTSAGVTTGQQLEGKSEEQLKELVNRCSIYARVSPEHKLKLVAALRAQAQIVAMTGDGVNDGPALKQADIGVAMGITGTDVAKEASDMVLRDDNFATIVAAVEEGRVIFDNVRKFIRYLLCSNASEIWVMLIGPLFGMPLPLLPLQILWMNLATDGLPALALGIEPAERNVMQRPPRSTQESVFAGGVGWDILWVGALMAIVSFGVGFVEWRADSDSPWQTMIFTTLVVSQLSLALAVRSERDSIWQLGWLSNKSLLAACALMFALQMVVVYVPLAQDIFKTQPLSATQLITCVLAGLVAFIGVEIEKAIRRWRSPISPPQPQA